MQCNFFLSAILSLLKIVVVVDVQAQFQLHKHCHLSTHSPLELHLTMTYPGTRLNVTPPPKDHFII